MQKWPNFTPLVKKSLLAPLHCPSEYCTVSDPPHCLSYTLPTYGYAVICHKDPLEEINPYCKQKQNWTSWEDVKGMFYLVGVQDTNNFKKLEISANQNGNSGTDNII